MSVLKLRVDLDRCIGSGHCVLREPRIFDQRDDGLVMLLDDSPPPELHAAAHRASDLCPSQAISIEVIP
jgi:ferredoxin